MRLRQVAVMKIDAEGMEMDILQGARTTLSKTRQVVMETHGRWRHDEAIKRLRHAGFDIDSDEFTSRTGLVFASRRKDKRA